ncbi:MAG: S8 family serine peptidase [Myxococcales bacterium]|nr:S8 family serine peptidase [Myxococcales bacterium]
MDRTTCGTGAGTRLAVIDNDAGATDHLELDAVELVGARSVSSGSRHGASLSAWAVGTRDAAFAGVAPDATLRHYYIPKPGSDVVSLALAIARAVDDGADVVLCATHVEGTWSPLLDDALELATRVGRRGLGTAVVMPAGRECSSPEGAVHASLSLGFGDPASDPRVLCVGPSSAAGGWFLYRDRRGVYRPFSNRGPAMRWLAPGDDLADPFRPGELAHAESSGAAAVAAGALLLVLGQNPGLTVFELVELVTQSATPLAGESSERRGLTVHREIEPASVDRDGHNVKHGYGRIHATRACLLARDPISGALVSMGEDGAARAWQSLVAADSWYSPEFARWAAKTCFARPELRQALSALVRHARLLAPDPGRGEWHAVGAVARQTAVLLRALLSLRDTAPPAVDAELEALARAALASSRMPDLRSAWSRYVSKASQCLWPDAVGKSKALASLAAT